MKYSNKTVNYSNKTVNYSNTTGELYKKNTCELCQNKLVNHFQKKKPVNYSIKKADYSIKQSIGQE